MDDAVDEALRVLRDCGYTFTAVGERDALELTRAALASVVQPGASRNLVLRAAAL
jgi:hypothetical protein